MRLVSILDYLKIIFDDPFLTDAKLRLMWEKGIIEEYDILNQNNPIDRKGAARIAHQYMLKEMHIEDIKDISQASVLRDLYDCRVCVNHIAQVYLRHVMDGIEIPGLSESKFIVFGSKNGISVEETERIKKRLISI